MDKLQFLVLISYTAQLLQTIPIFYSKCVRSVWPTAEFRGGALRGREDMEDGAGKGQKGRGGGIIPPTTKNSWIRHRVSLSQDSLFDPR